MAEYIDRDEVIAWIWKQKRLSKGYVVMVIQDLPAADVAPVVHGRWKMSSDRPDTIICTCCDSAFDVWKADIKRHHYCPNCGARMNDCESCIHYPPSAADGKPCCFCETTDPLLNCYQRKDDEPDEENNV